MGLSEAPILEEILNKIERLEKEYEWLGAAESFEKALKLLPQDDFLKVGETYERLGYAFYRAAFQADSNDEFRQRLSQAIAGYENAGECHQRVSEQNKAGRMLRCQAMIAYLSFWLTSNVPEKKRLLSECWSLTKKSLSAFEGSGEPCEYGKTYSELSGSAIFIFTFEPDFKSREKVMREAVESGETAIKFLSKCDDPSELARVCTKTVVCLGVFGYYCQDLNEREKYVEKGLDYWARARELSGEAAMTEFVYPVFGCQPFFGLEATDEAFANYEKALEYGKKIKDKFVIGCALDWLTYQTVWKLNATDDPDEKTRLAERAVHFAEEANHHFSIISYSSPRGDVVPVAGIDVDRWMLLSDLETDLKKKRNLLEKGLESYPSVAKRIEEWGYPEILMYVQSGRCWVRQQRAKFETSLDERRKLLEEALFYSNEYVEMIDQLEPFNYWNRGASHSQLRGVKFELASLVKDPETKKVLLQEAVTSAEKAIELCVKELTFMERKGAATSLFYTVGRLQHECGNTLLSLYKLTNDKELLGRAAKAYEDATESYQKLNLIARIAESRWKKAQVYDALGEHLNASEGFNVAASDYRSASGKIPQLKDFYIDHALYMQAWGEIERARYHHERQEYGLAKEHFEKAAELHKSIKRWSYLEPNYSAWARVEDAEELSRKERCEEAIKAFESASNLFSETKKSVQAQLSKIEDDYEKQMVTGIVKASGLRKEYCDARISLEEAKILDKEGDHFGSSRKYGAAAESFEKICQTLESEQERKEFLSIISLSRAWQKMMLGDARASPELYSEASALFEQASRESDTEIAGFLALGHSRFCRALEAGTRFADTGDTELQRVAMQNLEVAAKYYVKAGFQSASEYAKATGLLFEAYVHMDTAKGEKDPEKKSKLYLVAEKVLQTSAGSFMKAEHPEKREQVLRLLEKVREERELALSIKEVLQTPSIVSATTSFSAPAPTSEEAVGSERFEHADVQANVIIRQKELKIGEGISVELELVNAGKASALLTKVTEIIPKGFEVAQEPEVYRVENDSINLKGKRLDPLKTEEVKLVLKPTLQGTFSIKPMVLYLDENGKYRTHEPEPVTVTVKELGIKGWLKGEK
jgi:tetratricopeptide (TPR) repeat protein